MGCSCGQTPQMGNPLRIIDRQDSCTSNFLLLPGADFSSEIENPQESECGDGKGDIMFAVIKSGGRQYKVSVGQTLEVNRLPVEAGQQVQFKEVLLISDATNTMIGAPLVDNAIVLATATRQGRGKKLIVFRYKPKKRIRHRRGHRRYCCRWQEPDYRRGSHSQGRGTSGRGRDRNSNFAGEYRGRGSYWRSNRNCGD